MSYTAFDRFVAWCRFRAAIEYVQPHSRVCDIGCGLDAAFLCYAQSRIGWGIGLDHQSFRGPNSQQPAVAQCDISRGIPTRDGQFDHAVMLAVLEHIETPRPMLAEIYRVLAPGGSLIMTWPNAIVDPILNVLHGVGMVSREMESDKHQARIPVSELVTTLRDIGFNRFKHRRFEFGLNNLLVSWKP